jgi:hypothetical protein
VAPRPLLCNQAQQFVCEIKKGLEFRDIQNDGKYFRPIDNAHTNEPPLRERSGKTKAQTFVRSLLSAWFGII